MREDGRSADQLRPITIQTGFNEFAEGAAIITMGKTIVHCTASIEDKVPPFIRGSGSGWVTAEYDMLPRSTSTRNQRDRTRQGANGRSQEIQRLIGRALRSVCDMNLLGERSIIIDCDVLQADGGTRTASITGAWVALTIALDKLIWARQIREMPLQSQVGAVSAGVVDGTLLLDLCYSEDSTAQVDFNVVGTDLRTLIEIQGSGEKAPFSKTQLSKMLDLAQNGLEQIFLAQREALAEYGVKWPR